MSESSIARRYAKALIEIAQDEGKLEPYRLELENFSAAARVSPELIKILANRFLPVGSRMGVIDELAKKLSLSTTVIHFLKFLVHKGRMDLFKFIAESYRRQAYLIQNKEEAYVTTAVALSEASTDEIKKILEKVTKKSMILHKDIDPAVLAGVRVRVGNDVYDGTARTELDKLSLKMNHGII